MSVLRNRFKDRFVQVPNVLVTDTRISIPARLVYVYLRSKPDGWIVRNGDVMKSLGIKDSGAMAKYWHELETSGWIIRHKTSTGTFDYELNETDPIGEKPYEGKTATGEKPYEGKTPIINNTDSYSNTDFFNNKNINKQKDTFTANEKSKIQETCSVVRLTYPRCNYPILADRAVCAAVKRIARERDIDIISACNYLQERVKLYAECKYGAERQYLPEANNWLDNGGYDANEKDWTKGAENGTNAKHYTPKNF